MVFLHRPLATSLISSFTAPSTERFMSHHAAGTVASTWCSFLQRLAELGRRLKVVEEIFENMDKYQRGR
ncbi:hypothetical protein P8452_27305 [Trifolium repens]|nr:hypothetical protein P8452_27305 [Trifolium repens]